MLRKPTMLRLGLALLAALASFGALNTTAPSAEALWCAESFLGCEFSHVGVFNGEYACCVYQCENGSQKIGVCERI